MKKFLSLLIAFAMVFTVFPFTAFASENTYEEIQIATKACAAFPEYADKIQAKLQNADAQIAAFSDSPRTIVTNETRDISDKESITYTEFSDGLILLASSSVSHSVSSGGSSTSGSKTTYTITISTSLVGYSGCTAKLKNVKYVIDTSGYDKITSAGTTEKGTNCTGCSARISRSTETSSQKAEMVASITYLYGNASAGQFCSTELVMTVGNNQRSISYSNLDWGY